MMLIMSMYLLEMIRLRTNVNYRTNGFQQKEKRNIWK